MSKHLRELRDKRNRIIARMRDLNDTRAQESRAFSDEDEASYDRMMDEQEGLRADIAREERLLELERDTAERNVQSGQSDPGSDGPEVRPEARAEQATGEARMAGFRKFLVGGLPALSGDEARALQADSDTAGGYVVAPQRFMEQLLKDVDDLVFVRRRGTVIPMRQAESLGVPTLDANPADADWTAELATGNEDTAMAFGKREMRPHPMAKRIKVSNKLLRVSVLDVDAIVRQRLAYKFGITTEKAYLTGDGVQKPLGVFTANANGITTGRDVLEGNTTTSITFDGLISAKYSVKGQYWPRLAWAFHRDALKQISKLKDGESQYIWRESVRPGEPDRILNFPFETSEYVPNTFTASQYVGILGDWSTYWVIDALDMQVQRLFELYAETNQTGYIGRYEGDGAPVLEEAWARVQLAAS